MPQKVGKKVGIHFYENVLSEINLPLMMDLGILRLLSVGPLTLFKDNSFFR